MAEKSDKKKNEVKKNQADIRSGTSDSSTFSYEVPIPGAAPETIRMDNASRDFHPLMNTQSWAMDHVKRSVLQLEQILREIVFEFIREYHRQEMDYQKALLSRLSLIDPSIASWVRIPFKNLGMMESIPLAAEDMISRLASSNWIGVDDRQDVLNSLIIQVKALSAPCTEILLQESQKLDSVDFVKIKQRKLNQLSEFVQRLRGIMQQWIDTSVPEFGHGMSVVAHPPVDILESQTHLIARAAIPGLKTEQVFVSILNQGNLLEISGESPMPTERSIQNEIPNGKFKRIIKLPFQVEEKSLDASVNLGILMIKMKKAGCTKVDIGV